MAVSPTKSGVEVREVAGGGERRAFLRFPWSIYRTEPNWVPPLVSAVDRQLDATRHPFFEHAEARLYLAWRAGRMVGRIAAIINHLYNSYHNEKAGFWGFFESVDDVKVARALLDRACEDVRSRGMNCSSGPFNPSTNAECGLLVEGFEHPPVVLMPYNPRYYPVLVEAAGFERAKDLYAYRLTDEDVDAGLRTRQRLERIAAAVRRRHPEVAVRPLDMARYEAEVVALGELFNEARRDNWGYVPTTDAELRLMAREMRAIVEPGLVLVAEVEGRPIGCVMAIPDVNPVLKKLNGRLLPFGWVRFLAGRRRVSGIRVFGAACLPEYRKLGVTPLLFERLIESGERLGYRQAELSWIAEDNVQSVRTLEAAFEPRLYKRYRVYARAL